MLLRDEFDKLVASVAFPDYYEFLECREIVDDCLLGQRTIKSKTKYLPPTKWQMQHPEKYKEFLCRALFPNETKYSLDIYEGLFHLGTPQIQLPDDGRMDYIVRDASVYRDGLKNIQVRCNKEQMAHGLRMLLLEVREDADKPFFIQEYGANKYLRGHFTDRINRGEFMADAILLNETGLENNLKNWLNPKVEVRFRILGLDENGEYYQRRLKADELADFDVLKPPQDDRTVYPAYRGRRFHRIPYVFCGATGLSGINLDMPPLLSMAQTELKLYLSSAHHSQHIFMNTQESIVITGASSQFKLKNDEFVAGAVVVIPGEKADAKYLSTNGVGFDAEEKEIERLQNTIEQKRLSLMNAKSHQSGTVVGLVQNSQSAPLRTVVSVSGNAITEVLKHMASWMGYSYEVVESISYTPSEEFANPRVNLSEFISLCNAVNQGTVQMLEEDLYTMAKESGYINSKLTWDQFKRKYDVEQEEREQRNGIVATGNGNPFSNVTDEEGSGADADSNA